MNDGTNMKRLAELRAQRRQAEYQSQIDQFVTALKKDWRMVKYDPKTGEGSADLGGFGITFHESGNDGAVVVNFTKVPRMKAHAEAVLDALEDLRKVWGKVD